MNIARLCQQIHTGGTYTPAVLIFNTAFASNVSVPKNAEENVIVLNVTKRKCKPMGELLRIQM